MCGPSKFLHATIVVPHLLCFGETGTPSNRRRFSARCFGVPVRDDGVSLNARAISAFRLAGGAMVALGAGPAQLTDSCLDGVRDSAPRALSPAGPCVHPSPLARLGVVTDGGEPDAGVPYVRIGGAGEGNPSCLVRQNNRRGFR
jgi:hypothetical protein